MIDTPAVAQLMASAVGLMGAMVAGLSVYVAYKGRHNPIRQVVYGRQMDAYFNIAGSMADLYAAAQDALVLGGPWLKGDDARVRLRAVLREDHERFAETVNRSLIVLPSKVKEAVDGFNEALLAVAEPAEAGHGGAGIPAEAADGLARAYERAINCIRHHLAVDSLTTGMLAEMGIGSESVTLRSFRPSLNPLVPVRRELAPSRER
jgi:hypothetical protein